MLGVGDHHAYHGTRDGHHICYSWRRANHVESRSQVEAKALNPGLVPSPRSVPSVCKGIGFARVHQPVQLDRAWDQ
jgi:hypothetical protein